MKQRERELITLLFLTKGEHFSVELSKRQFFFFFQKELVNIIIIRINAAQIRVLGKVLRRSAKIAIQSSWQRRQLKIFSLTEKKKPFIRLKTF